MPVRLFNLDLTKGLLRMVCPSDAPGVCVQPLEMESSYLLPVSNTRWPLLSRYLFFFHGFINEKKHSVVVVILCAIQAM